MRWRHFIQQIQVVSIFLEDIIKAYTGNLF